LKVSLKQLFVTLTMSSLLGLTFGFSGFYHRRDFDRAFGQWMKNKTPETEHALQAERDKSERLKFLTSMKTSIFLFFLLNSVVFIVEKRLGTGFALFSLSAATLIASTGLPWHPAMDGCCEVFIGSSHLTAPLLRWVLIAVFGVAALTSFILLLKARPERSWQEER